MNTVLEVSDLHVEIASRRGVVHAVDGISLEVPAGQAVGVVGESGSGKSMTLRAMLGVLPPEAKITAGRVLLDAAAAGLGQCNAAAAGPGQSNAAAAGLGQSNTAVAGPGQSHAVDLTQLSNSQLNRIRGPKIAMIFQEPMSALNPVMRVGAQIAEGPRIHLGMSRGQAGERAIELMRRVGIPDPERRYRAYPHEFSGGMRQRVMIAIALSCEPSVILCDEPTTALDVTIQDQILRLLSQLCRESGTSLVFVTHDLPVVAQVCDQLTVMYAGQIVEAGPVKDVLTRPCHPYTLGLVRSAPDVDHVRSSLLAIPGSPPSLINPPTGCRFHPRCSFAEEDCTTTMPPLDPIGAGRATACLHYERCLEALDAQGADR